MFTAAFLSPPDSAMMPRSKPGSANSAAVGGCRSVDRQVGGSDEQALRVLLRQIRLGAASMCIQKVLFTRLRGPASKLAARRGPPRHQLGRVAVAGKPDRHAAAQPG